MRVNLEALNIVYTASKLLFLSLININFQNFNFSIILLKFY